VTHLATSNLYKQLPELTIRQLNSLSPGLDGLEKVLWGNIVRDSLSTSLADLEFTFIAV
jgi:hypothetical protein